MPASFASKAKVQKTNLNMYLKELEKENPELKAAYHKWKSAVSYANSKGYLPDPQFLVGVYMTEVETKVGPQKQKFGFSQKVPFKGKLKLQKSLNKELAKSMYENYSQIKLNIELKFRSNYYFLCYLKEQQKIIDSHIKLLIDFAKILRASYESDLSSYNSLLKVEIEISKLKDKLVSINKLQLPVIGVLNALLDRKTDAEIITDSLDSLPVQKFTESDEISIIANLYVTSPELRSVSYRIKSKQYAKELASKNYYPDFTFSVDYINTGSTNITNLEGDGKDPLIFKVGFNVPFFNKKYKSIDIAANEEYLSVVKQHVFLKNNKSVELQKAFYNYFDSLRKQKLYKDSIIPAANQSLKVNFSSFETGSTSYLDVIDSERILLEFSLNYQKAVLDTLVAVSQIVSLSGNKNAAKNTKGE
jgi:outer membrane protein TolC